MKTLLTAIFAAFITLFAGLPAVATDSLIYEPEIDTVERRQLECLAMNIYREAGGQSFEGKVAVAQVTLNRLKHPKFPDEVCAVVYQKTKVFDKIVCQFSWSCDKSIQARPINKSSYQESYEVAKQVLLEGFRLPELKNALFFHAATINPGWVHRKIGEFGGNVFYELRRQRSSK